MSTNEEHHYWPPTDPKVVKEELITSTSQGGNFLKKLINKVKLYLIHV